MSMRFDLAQLIERRIKSILQDAEQLIASMDPHPETEARALGLRAHLEVADVWTEKLMRTLAALGEGETKQDDLPNLAEDK